MWRNVNFQYGGVSREAASGFEVNNFANLERRTMVIGKQIFYVVTVRGSIRSLKLLRFERQTGGRHVGNSGPSRTKYHWWSENIRLLFCSLRDIAFLKWILAFWPAWPWNLRSILWYIFCLNLNMHCFMLHHVELLYSQKELIKIIFACIYSRLHIVILHRNRVFQKQRSNICWALLYLFENQVVFSAAYRLIFHDIMYHINQLFELFSEMICRCK